MTLNATTGTTKTTVRQRHSRPRSRPVPLRSHALEFPVMTVPTLSSPPATPAHRQCGANTGPVCGRIYPGCPWQLGLQYAGNQSVIDQCAAHQRDWYEREIPQWDPDLVFVAQGPYANPASPNRFLDDHKNGWCR